MTLLEPAPGSRVLGSPVPAIRPDVSIPSGDDARTVAHIAAAVVRLTLKDPVSLFFMFLLPFFIISVVGTALAVDTGRPVGVVVADHGPLATRLLDRLRHDHVLHVDAYSDRGGLNRDVRRRLLTAGVVIPAGYDAALRSGHPVEVPLVVADAKLVPEAVRIALARDIEQESMVVTAASAAAARTGSTFDHALALADATGAQMFTPVTQQRLPTRTTNQPRGVQFSAPANLVLFMFVNILGSAVGLIAGRRRGATRRAMLSPRPWWVPITGEICGRAGLALLQASVILVVGAALFHVRWGNPVGVGCVVVTFAVFAGAASVLLAGLARSEAQGFALAPPIGILLGMLGGCLWPIAIVGPGLRHVAAVLPTGWAMTALVDLGSGGADVGDVAAYLVALAVAAFALCAIAVAVTRRRFAQRVVS